MYGNISVYLLLISGSGSEELNKKILPAMIRGVKPVQISSGVGSMNVFCRSCLTSAKFPAFAAFHSLSSLPLSRSEKQEKNTSFKNHSFINISQTISKIQRDRIHDLISLCTST